MSKRSIVDWLGDIIAWGERLENHIAGMTYGDFIGINSKGIASLHPSYALLRNYPATLRNALAGLPRPFVNDAVILKSHRLLSGLHLDRRRCFQDCLGLLAVPRLP
jgi:hypothetical protein